VEQQTLAFIMLVAIAVGIFLGFPVFAVFAGVSLIFGLVGWGAVVFDQMVSRGVWILMNDALPAIPLFIFMGVLLQRAGIAEKAFGVIQVALGPLRGSLALATVFISTLVAAGSGVIGAGVTIMSLIALPKMIERNYDIPLATGSILAGGTLGILIPPSIMLILYGPLADISVARLFTGALMPGLVLSALYLLYITIRCAKNPQLGPPLPPEERTMPKLEILASVLLHLVPFILIIVAVLGSIIFGIAAPTEAAAVGVVAVLILTAVYRKLTWQAFKSSVYEAMVMSTFVLTINMTASMFTGVFLALGGGDMITSFLLGLPIGPYGVVAVIMAMIFVLGFFIDWIAILLIFVPIFAPLVPMLGFDPLWFGVIVAVCLQTSFMTPPFAISIFFLKGLAPPSVRITQIYRGVIPFVILQLIGLSLVIIFPQLALWLPSVVYH